MNDVIKLAWVAVALSVVACVYRIARSALQDRSRQIELRFKLLGLVDGSVIIRKAPSDKP